MNIYTMKVIVKCSIKATKHKQKSSNKSTWVSSSRHWATSTNNESPFSCLRIKVVEIILVFSVSTSKDEHLVIIDWSWMPPSRNWNIPFNFKYLSKYLCLLGIFNERCKIKFDDILKILVLILIMATSIDINFIFYRTRTMESSGFELHSLELKSDPSICLQIKSPHIIKVFIRLSSNHNHVVIYYCCWMISSWLWTFTLSLMLSYSASFKIKLEHIIILLLTWACSSKYKDVIFIEYSCMIWSLQTCCKPMRSLESNLL